MLQTLGQKAIVVVVLFLVLLWLIHWAKANPTQAQATFDKVATAVATAVSWTADQVTNALNGSSTP